MQPAPFGSPCQSGMHHDVKPCLKRIDPHQAPAPNQRGSVPKIEIDKRPLVSACKRKAAVRVGIPRFHDQGLQGCVIQRANGWRRKDRALPHDAIPGPFLIPRGIVVDLNLPADLQTRVLFEWWFVQWRIQGYDSVSHVQRNPRTTLCASGLSASGSGLWPGRTRPTPTLGHRGSHDDRFCRQ